MKGDARADLPNPSRACAVAEQCGTVARLAYLSSWECCEKSERRNLLFKCLPDASLSDCAWTMTLLCIAGGRWPYLIWLGEETRK